MNLFSSIRCGNLEAPEVFHFPLIHGTCLLSRIRAYRRPPDVIFIVEPKETPSGLSFRFLDRQAYFSQVVPKNIRR